MSAFHRLQEYLDRYHVPYEVMSHQEAYTAPEIAHALHVPGKLFAKVVIAKADDRFVMLVLPSNRLVDFTHLRAVLGARHLRLATEAECKSLFPDCETGAMPPFGNLYDVPVYVDVLLAEDDEIVFEAGTHFGAVKLRYRDFAELVRPVVTEFHQAPTRSGG
jgi:Ala-tRNA(Pro) deacylase